MSGNPWDNDPVLSPKNTVGGDQFLQTLDPRIGNVVKLMVQGRMIPPSSMALRTPYWQQMIQNAAQYDPTFDEATWYKRVQAQKDFAPGGKDAANIESANKVLAHLNGVYSAYNQLGNTGFTPLNAAANYGAKHWGLNPQLAGSLGDLATHTEAVATELPTYLRGSGQISEKDVQAWRDRFSHNAAPSYFNGGIGAAADIIKKRYEAAQNKWAGTFGPKVPMPQFISPENSQVLSHLMTVGNQGGDVQQQSQMPQPAQQNQPKTIRFQDLP